MSATAPEHADVLVVGAGPTGLMLAGDLAQAGVRVTVLERRAQESNVTRAFAVHARTLEELQIRGVAGELTPTGTAIRGLRLYGRATIDRTNPIPTRPSQVERVMNADVQDRAVDGRRKRGPRPSRRIGWAALTPSELKIAALVAQGLTNPQIATRLFLSRSTVQTHLENVFAKLDIGSRVVLAAEIARRSA